MQYLVLLQMTVPLATKFIMNIVGIIFLFHVIFGSYLIYKQILSDAGDAYDIGKKKAIDMIVGFILFNFLFVMESHVEDLITRLIMDVSMILFTGFRLGIIIAFSRQISTVEKPSKHLVLAKKGKIKNTGR